MSAKPPRSVDERAGTPTKTSPQADVAPASDGDVDAFLRQVQQMPTPRRTGTRGRLIFAMDATMSRQPTWDIALGLQAEMFREVARVGALDVQLVYFRGFNECRSSKWVGNASALARLMTTVECRGGRTQIGRVLLHAGREQEQARVDALVYVGDAMEEDADDLCHRAGELGVLGVPVFMFQEGHHSFAEATFREIARLSRGAYCRFDAGSAAQLSQLLSAVAVFASGGRAALSDYSNRHGGGATRLLEQLK